MKQKKLHRKSNDEVGMSGSPTANSMSTSGLSGTGGRRGSFEDIDGIGADGSDRRNDDIDCSDNDDNIDDDGDDEENEDSNDAIVSGQMATSKVFNIGSAGLFPVGHMIAPYEPMSAAEVARRRAVANGCTAALQQSLSRSHHLPFYLPTSTSTTSSSLYDLHHASHQQQSQRDIVTMSATALSGTMSVGIDVESDGDSC